MTAVIGVRFQPLGKLYHFRSTDDVDQQVEPGDHVVVRTKRGRQLGQVIGFVEPDQVHAGRGLKSIERKASPRDLVMKQVWEQRELDALITCRHKASDLGVYDAKFVKAEYSFDGGWLTILYSTENRQLDVRSLLKALRRNFRCKVDLQMIGPRDVAKILGGHGACGQPRCCSTFLTEFSPISIRMAKAQGISLSPQEITGMCGRLRCCLIYEYEQYIEAKKLLPKIGKKIGTPYGEGIVKDVRVLRDSVVVDVNGEYREVFRHEYEPLAELAALEKKAAEGCDKHEGGQCDCGAKNGNGNGAKQ
jgi:cell fate regulator YaaT (PSP1 superfamily)